MSKFWCNSLIEINSSNHRGMSFFKLKHRCNEKREFRREGEGGMEGSAERERESAHSVPSLSCSVLFYDAPNGGRWVLITSHTTKKLHFTDCFLQGNVLMRKVRK